MLKRTILVLVVLLAMIVLPAAAAFAASTGNTGQPSQSCEDPATSTTPGHSSTAPGSAFNPDGHSGTVYAGEQPQNSGNPKSVSQYDVACFQNSMH